MSVRRLSAACLAVWLLSFLTCSLHCTLGSVLSHAPATAHSCCAGKSQKSDMPGSPLAGGSCHTFRDLTVSDSASVRVDLAPQWIAVVTPFLVSGITAPVTVEIKPFTPEPDLGPPSHLPMMRLAGRAPPSLA